MKYTKKQIKNRSSDYVCFDCGRLFLSEEQKERENVLTCHDAECGLCHQTKSITHIRAFNYLRKRK